MKSQDKESIFDGISQILDVDPGDIKPIWSRVLIRDIPEGDTTGSLYIPQKAQNKEKIRVGVVVAVGPGDPFVEIEYDDKTHTVVRRGLGVDARGERVRIPMCVKPGDRVLYDRRREAEVYVKGERLTLAYEEQSVLAILEA